jgi:23S rRNA (adenine2030-N6)-methyltransferase
MNYRHAFHAGNSADVLKHLTLIALLQSLTAKPKPLRYLDTHAGRGFYALDSLEAQRSGEAALGIERLRAAFSERASPPLIAEYFRLIDNTRAAHGASAYPGSPAIAAALLRADDKLVLAELQRDEHAALRAHFVRDRRIQCRATDGYGLLKSDLPPPERRALVLIDPPYEQQIDEYATILTALEHAFGRFPTGVYALWYPVKLKSEVQGLVRDVRAQFAGRPSLRIELHEHPPITANRLNGSGMLMLNPPWRLLQSLEPALHAARAAWALSDSLPLLIEST